MVLSPKDLRRSVSLSVHCDKRKEKNRLFVGAGCSCLPWLRGRLQPDALV
jgi:hypothetical protein